MIKNKALKNNDTYLFSKFEHNVANNKLKIKTIPKIRIACNVKRMIIKSGFSLKVVVAKNDLLKSNNRWKKSVKINKLLTLNLIENIEYMLKAIIKIKIK